VVVVFTGVVVVGVVAVLVVLVLALSAPPAEAWVRPATASAVTTPAAATSVVFNKRVNRCT
jgi:hypothetical protein